MRIFAISDIHVDYEDNFRWINDLSRYDYQNDFLIVAGDVTDLIPLFEITLKGLRERFLKVFFIPGNHDLWVRRSHVKHSLEKLQIIKNITADCGILMEPFCCSSLSIVPLFSWYDYSFERPSQEIFEIWTDYVACKWPVNYDINSITQYFISMNENAIIKANKNQVIITYSHFLPRIDIMPFYVPHKKSSLYAVLGTVLLEKQIRKLGSYIHIYGHIHLNNQVVKDDTIYINNAFGYPYETRTTTKQLKCIFEI